jgi:hypothetical protein
MLGFMIYFFVAQVEYSGKRGRVGVRGGMSKSLFGESCLKNKQEKREERYLNTSETVRRQRYMLYE